MFSEFTPKPHPLIHIPLQILDFKASDKSPIISDTVLSVMNFLFLQGIINLFLRIT